MLALALLAVSLNWNFEGGSLVRAERVSETHWRCHVHGETDQDNRNRQASWYFFRVDNARGRELTLDIVDLPGEYNYQPNRGAITRDTPPFYSEDEHTWRPVDNVEFDDAEPRMRLRLKPHSDHLWIAHVPPYTARNLAELLADVGRSPHLESASAGRSAGGRDIPLLTITDRSVPDASKKVLWLMFRQHAWEAGSSWAGDGLIRFLTFGDETAARNPPLHHRPDLPAMRPRRRGPGRRALQSEPLRPESELGRGRSGQNAGDRRPAPRHR